MHVVVSTYNADPDQLLPWIWHLGLTNAAVYVYYRIQDPAIPAMYDGVQLPCNMSLIVRRLLPNKGREAAVFLHHIVRHYRRLPLALMLAHDHGPASRHSLCGPFYRRARGYYRGTALRLHPNLGADAEAEGGAGAGQDSLVAEGAGEGRDGSVSAAARAVEQQEGYALLARFSSMAVTLNSGCIANWAKGCCSLFICSSSAITCPFRDANCTRIERSRREPHGVRNVFLHQNGRYDARYENQVIDPYDGSYKPVSLLRYTSAEHRSTDMWNVSHEYPTEGQRVSKDQTLQMLRELLQRYDFKRRRRSSFKSCCASLILRADHVRRWPVQLYKDLLAYSMDPSLDYEATKAVSGPGWALWLDRQYTINDIMHYLKVDGLLRSIQGCPAQSSRHLQGILQGMRAKGTAAQAQQEGAAG